MQYRVVVVVQPNESARASDVKTHVSESWFSVTSRDGGSLWGCDNCDWAEMIPAESFLRIDRAIDEEKLLSRIKSENYALFFWTNSNRFFFLCSRVVVPSF